MNDKLNKIVEELKTLTLLEAAELVKEIEEVFGVDTSVSVGAVAMAAPAAAQMVMVEVVMINLALTLV